MTRRADRVAELIQRELARLLASEIADPRVGFVTVSGVDVSDDLRNARIYVSRFDDDPAKIPPMLKGLDSARGYLKRELAKALDLRVVPDLHFRHDPGGQRGARIAAILNEDQVIAADNRNTGPHDDSYDDSRDETRDRTRGDK